VIDAEENSKIKTAADTNRYLILGKIRACFKSNNILDSPFRAGAE